MSQLTIKLDGVWIRAMMIGMGTTMYVARCNEADMPCGYLWARLSNVGQRKKKGLAEILDCYVPHWARRQGIMRKMVGELSKEFPTLRSDFGTTDGLPFLKACGFKFDRRFGWVFEGRP
jgi:hypothetical protein